ncbi:MAG: FAD-dependent oxidoreductase [Candidatus Limnocylindria bacterium]
MKSRRRPIRLEAPLLATMLVLQAMLPAPTIGAPRAAGDVPQRTQAAPVHADVVVYGGTPSGVLAAHTAARAGAQVILLEPTAHVGGMVSSGLGATDFGHTTTIGGYTRQFFDRTQAIEGTGYGRYRFQPSTAEAAFDDMLADAGVTVMFGERLAEVGGVIMDGTRILSIQTETGLSASAEVFIDASYEGDLMADAGVSYRIGRESMAEHGESLAGIRNRGIVFDVPTGTLPGFPVAEPVGPVGGSDNRIQTTNYRPCFSTNSANQVPFPQPDGYDPATYDIVADYIDSRVAQGHTPLLTWFLWPVFVGDAKYDVNSNSSISIGVHGANYAYPDATYAERAQLEAWLRGYTKGFLYFLANDERVPEELRDEMNRYGLCADEFTDNENWPRTFYLREGRRLDGVYTVTQRDVQVTRTKPDTIAIASYALDTHHVSRWLDSGHRLAVEGAFFTSRAQATRWSIPYRSLTPRPDEATNLLVSVAASATHVAWASLRMEPQFMMMGEAAGQAAAMIASHPGPATVQSLNVPALQGALRAHGAIVDNPLFVDIASSPFKGEIEATFLAGMVISCSPIAFCPTTAMTREVMAAFLHRTLDLPPATQDYFTDDEASPHEDSINRLAEADLTGGCATNRFCPTSTMTRGQMAAFLVRSFDLPVTSQDFFTDDETSIFENDINRLAASGVTGGCGGGRFCPNRTVTRGEMAAFLWRATHL